MAKNNIDMAYILIDYAGVSREVLDILIRINGDVPKTYEDILFVYTNYTNFEKYLEEVGNEQ